MMAAVVAAMTLGELLGPAAGAHGALAVTDLVSDSRQVTPGTAFIALRGTRSHGLDFADEVLAAGAAIIIYEPDSEHREVPESALALPGLRERLGDIAQHFFGRTHAPDQLIGVTGTNGKTTVAWLCAQALTTLGETCGYIGTIGYGLPDKLKPQALTTPDCLSLHRELAELGTVSAAIEVSSHAISQHRIAGLGFDTAVFTNLSHDHLDWHGSMASYFETKASLFERPELGYAVVNATDPYGEALLGRLLPSTRAISIALEDDSSAEISARAEAVGLEGLVLDVSGSYGRTTIKSPLIGELNAENLLLALGVLVARGHEIGAAGEALAGTTAPPGRMEIFGGPPDWPWVIVDYAHTPAALTRVMSAITPLSSGELTCVFGCGGDRDRDKRAPMGRAAAALAEHIVLTDDNPRGEDPAIIIADVMAGTSGHSDVRIEHDRDRAIAGAVAAASPGDIVLVAGKGHETQQLFGTDSCRPFDDRAVVQRVLEGTS